MSSFRWAQVVSSSGIYDWAPEGSGAIIPSRRSTRYSTWVFVSPQGRKLWRRDLAAIHQDGRLGIWAIPPPGGVARLVVAYDEPALVPHALGISVGPDYLYLTVAEYERDIWVARLRY